MESGSFLGESFAQLHHRGLYNDPPPPVYLSTLSSTPILILHLILLYSILSLSPIFCPYIRISTPVFDTHRHNESPTPIAVDAASTACISLSSFCQGPRGSSAESSADGSRTIPEGRGTRNGLGQRHNECQSPSGRASWRSETCIQLQNRVIPAGFQFVSEHSFPTVAGQAVPVHCGKPAFQARCETSFDILL